MCLLPAHSRAQRRAPGPLARGVSCSHHYADGRASAQCGTPGDAAAEYSVAGNQPAGVGMSSAGGRCARCRRQKGAPTKTQSARARPAPQDGAQQTPVSPSGEQRCHQSRYKLGPRRNVVSNADGLSAPGANRKRPKHNALVKVQDELLGWSRCGRESSVPRVQRADVVEVRDANDVLERLISA